MADQRSRIIAVFRVGRHIDADRQVHSTFATDEGAGQRVEYLSYERVDSVRVTDGRVELVATEACQQRALARLVMDMLRHHV